MGRLSRGEFLVGGVSLGILAAMYPALRAAGPVLTDIEKALQQGQIDEAKEKEKIIPPEEIQSILNQLKSWVLPNGMKALDLAQTGWPGKGGERLVEFLEGKKGVTDFIPVVNRHRLIRESGEYPPSLWYFADLDPRYSHVITLGNGSEAEVPEARSLDITHILEKQSVDPLIEGIWMSVMAASVVDHMDYIHSYNLKRFGMWSYNDRLPKNKALIKPNRDALALSLAYWDSEEQRKKEEKSAFNDFLRLAPVIQIGSILYANLKIKDPSLVQTLPESLTFDLEWGLDHLRDNNLVHEENGAVVWSQQDHRLFMSSWILNSVDFGFDSANVTIQFLPADLSF